MRKIIRSWSIALGSVFFFFGLAAICLAQSAKSESSPNPDSSSKETGQPLATIPAARTAPMDEPHATSGKLSQVILFERPGAPGKISIDKIRQSLKLAAQELHTPGDALPGTIFFHISESEAELFGVKRTSIWQTAGREGGIRFEIWIVGEPTDEDYSKLAVVLLEHYFNVAIDPTEGKRVALVVTKKLNGMVSAEELGFYKPPAIVSIPPPAQGYVASTASYSEKRAPVICHP
ncbi:MAG TPA: hypothetical protein VGH37_17125 [Candidatus Acidoferrum sp.]|jgi:hypothetical protein